jgi:carotenoid 1,2-hydratase
VPAGGPGFENPVCDSGYAWWYLDALSDDRRNGITLIAFIGSVFSPYYAWARRGGAVDPADHIAFNVALYGEVRRWTLTERGRDAMRRSPSALEIGPSAMSWDGNALSVEIDEVSVPVPKRVRGRVRLYFDAPSQKPIILDGDGRHRWRPLAPRARVEVAFERPALRWSGSGYFDTNTGDEPLEAAFSGWYWSRASLRQGAVVFYDVSRRRGDSLSLAMRFDRSGNVDHFEPPPLRPLPRTGWRLARAARADAGHPSTVVETLEDAPFYARSVLAAQLLGERTMAIHESLSLDRFSKNWVRLLLPFRMPRAWR